MRKVPHIVFVFVCVLSWYSIAGAAFEYAPTGGALTTGTNAAVSATNVGSWRGALASDNVYWVLTGSAGAPAGLDVSLSVNNVELRGANKLVVTVEILNANAALTHAVQIYDNTAATWRTLNTREANYSGTAEVRYTYQVYDGYWQSGGSPVSTPLSNFVTGDANRQVQIRIYSTASSATNMSIDLVSVEPAIDPIYLPAARVNVSGGTETNTYNYACGDSATTYGDDASVHQIAGTAGLPVDFYYRFKNVQTYTGANAIVLNTQDSASAAGFNYNYWICNTPNPGGGTCDGGWEQLNSAVSTGTTYTDRQFAKANVDLANYVGSGEVWIKYKSATNTANSVRVDRAYIIVGTVNTDSAQSETSFGTVAGGTTSTNTQSLDSTAAAPSTWQHTTTTTHASTAYGSDYAGTYATNYNAASNINFPITQPDDSVITGIVYAGLFRSNVATNTVTLAVRDFGGLTAATGGWTDVGATSASATYVYTDSLLRQTAATLGVLTSNAEDYFDSGNNRVSMRLRTSASTAVGAATRDWDFALTSIRWLQNANARSLRHQYTPTGGTLTTGSNAALSGTNVGSWRGALASDNVYWVLTGSAGAPAGLDVQLQVDGVQVMGANKLLVTVEILNANAALTHAVQIYDTVAATWRTLNTREANYTGTSEVRYTYQVYDGYWQSGGSPVSTPLENFVSDDANGRVLIRIYSTASSATNMSIDLVSVEPAIDPIYLPAARVNVSGGTETNTYNYAYGDSATTYGDDASVHQIAGTAGLPVDFYYRFKNVQTYTGANAIVLNTQDSGSAAGFNYDYWICNTPNPGGGTCTGGWEQLNSVSSTGTTYTDRQFAKANVNLANYVGSGEVWIKYKSTTNTANSVRVDRAYVIIGSVNTDSAQSETSFGTVAGGTTSTNTQSLDSTAAAPSTWQHNTVQTQASTAYGSDFAGTYATNYNAAANIDFAVTQPAGTCLTGIVYSSRHKYAANTIRSQPSARDFGGKTTTVGGWTDAGTYATNAYVYTDSFLRQTAANVGVLTSNPTDYLDNVNNETNMRLRSSVNTAAATGVRDWDFALMSIRYLGTSGVTPANVVSLKAFQKNGDTVFRFTSEGEIAVRGYRIYRAAAAADQTTYEAVSAFVPARGGPVSGKNYRVVVPGPLDPNAEYVLGIVHRGQPASYVGPVRIQASFDDEDNKVLQRTGKRSAEAAKKAGIEKRRGHAAGRVQAGGKARRVRPADVDGTIRISVDSAGVYRITRDDLESLGLPPGEYGRTNFRLFTAGKPVDFRRDGDTIDFYAAALSTKYTGRNVYMLVPGGKGSQMGQASSGRSAAPADYYEECVLLEENTSYFPEVAGEEHWFNLNELFSPATLDIDLPVDNFYPAGKASVNVRMQGYTSALLMGNNLQRVNVYVNDTLIGVEEWREDVPHEFTMTFDAAVLRAEGPNTLRLGLPDENGALPQYVLLDWVKFRYPRAFVARNDELTFTARSGDGAFRITGFTGSAIRVLDITETNEPKLVADASVEPDGEGFAVNFKSRGGRPRAFHAYEESAVKVPEEIAGLLPAHLTKKDEQFDYIIITHRDFIDAAQALAEHRRSQGLKVNVVDVQDIYDRFSDGIFDPAAIREFLRFAYTRWPAPAPRYVLLVGDGTFDYRDYQGNGSVNLVPAYLAFDPGFGEMPSDNWFVTFGDDVLPSMSIGRLPVNDAAQLTAFINKLIAYDHGAFTAGRHLFVADTHPRREFSSLADRLSLEFPERDEKLRFYLDGMPASAVNEGIMDGINTGVSFVTYTGHGGVILWSNEWIFSVYNIDALANTSYPFFLALTCGNGYFVYPHLVPNGELDSLGEKLLLADGKGAIGGVFPAAVSSPREQELFARFFYRAVFDTPVITAGEAVRQAFRRMSETDPVLVNPVVLTYNLLGDPAMELRK